jgi:DNA/RNA endonuclease YhcR with UshA esterase domain
MYCLLAAAVIVFSASLALVDDPAAKPITVEEAAKKVNEKVTVEFEVKATGQTQDRKRIFLNSETNFRSAKNFTIVLEGETLEKLRKSDVKDPRTYYRGKTIRVTGTVILYQNRPEIKLADVADIVVVEKAQKN